MVAVAEAAEIVGASDLDSATVEQLTKAWDLVRTTAGLSLRELATRIAAQAHLRVADLEAADERASVLLPPGIAGRRNVLPLRCTDRDVWIATANPLSQQAKREIAALTGRTVVFELAPPGDIAGLVSTTYGAASDREVIFDIDKDVDPPTGPHILVVDDEVGQRTLLRSVLEEAGFRVDLAKDGPTAVDLLDEDSSYDLVTLDYWMDRMNGLRVLQHIRGRGVMSAMPVIMVTGAGDRQIEMSLFEAGADDFIAKPIDPALFVLRIRAVLRRRRHA